MLNSHKFPNFNLQNLYKCSKFLLFREALYFELIFQTWSKTKHFIFPPKSLNWLVCGSMNRTKEEFDDAARQPLRTVTTDPNLYKSGSLSCCGFQSNQTWGNCSHGGSMSGSSSDFRLPRLLVSFNASKANKFHSVSTTGLGRFRPVKLAARLCGTCIPFDLNQCGPLCRIYQSLNPRFMTYVNGLISKITAHGAAFFWPNTQKKNTVLSKKYAPKPANDDM